VLPSKTLSALVFVVGSFLAIAALVFLVYAAPIEEVSHIPSSELAPVHLEQNQSLGSFPRIIRDDWSGIFSDQRMSYRVGLAIETIGLTTPLLGTRLDDFGLIWAPPTSAGHFMVSGRPGEGTNIVIVGHSGTGYVFEHLSEIEVADQIVITTVDGGSHSYRVSQIEIVPVLDATDEQLAANIEYVLPTHSERLTLITCWPRDGYTHRLIVIAEPS